MNSNQAKQIPLELFMEKLGREPIKRNGSRISYFSPFRDEKEPSFVIDTQENTWKDFGRSEKGAKIVDLVTRLFSCSVSKALERIDDLCGEKSVSAIKSSYNPNQLPLRAIPGEVEYKISKVCTLKNTALIAYLESRKINILLAKRFLEEIYYTTPKGSHFFALAFKNNSGGYETRNQYDKRSLISKDLTTITMNETRSCVLVFEGFMDFLSYATLTGEENLDKIHSIIVLSSISMREKGLAEIKKTGCKRVALLLDNDKTGKEATEYFKNELHGLEVDDQSGTYANYEDYNDYLLGKKMND